MPAQSKTAGGGGESVFHCCVGELRGVLERLGVVGDDWVKGSGQQKGFSQVDHSGRGSISIVGPTCACSLSRATGAFEDHC